MRPATIKYAFRLRATVTTATLAALPEAQRRQLEGIAAWRTRGDVPALVAAHRCDLWDLFEDGRAAFQLWAFGETGYLYPNDTTRLDLVSLRDGRLEPRISDPSPGLDRRADEMQRAWEER